VSDSPVAPAAPTPAPHEPANPEPLQEPIDPEKGRVPTPEPGKSEHPAV
jgi:hypothetical protein